jgi:hypothetical protein
MQKINGEVELLDLDVILEGDYASPEIFELGSLDKVESFYQGNYVDGPQSPYYYYW